MKNADVAENKTVVVFSVRDEQISYFLLGDRKQDKVFFSDSSGNITFSFFVAVFCHNYTTSLESHRTVQLFLNRFSDILRGVV